MLLICQSETCTAIRDRRTVTPSHIKGLHSLMKAILSGAILICGTGSSAIAQTPSTDSQVSPAATSSVSPPEIPAILERIVVTAPPLDAGYELRQGVEFEETLFSRDDQILHLLNGGINAGQHEGGGKSLEIRRYGFNLDHGGVSGGLKVLVDNVAQNYATGGHGQGYLGSMKSISPELVEDVTVLDGPFQAEYGDFSGLGVVQIHLRESMPQQLTTRMQAGSFDTYRRFVSFSPNVRNRDAVFAYEGSSTNGPFLKPLGYRRDNITALYLAARKRTPLQPEMERRPKWLPFIRPVASRRGRRRPPLAFRLAQRRRRWVCAIRPLGRLLEPQPQPRRCVETERVRRAITIRSLLELHILSH